MKEKEYIFVLRTFDWNQILTVRVNTFQGRIQDFKLGGAHLKKLRRAEGGAKIFGVFRVKNHDFTPKNLIFFQLRRETRKFLGYFVWKITILRQKIIFFPILGGGGRAGYAPLWIRPCICIYLPVQLRCQHNTFVYQSTNKFRP